eukprot:TRINITY_DN16680_c0_g1_i1.p1 TRINITY_DN16680_c0_g1~~TRINITY_DN16680_c0_g1_i1.p1  ORF type:complete len:790 (-),score=188.90 TRINITY_DN16680_c0_g1_i1:334-2646(-)
MACSSKRRFAVSIVGLLGFSLHGCNQPSSDDNVCPENVLPSAEESAAVSAQLARLPQLPAAEGEQATLPQLGWAEARAKAEALVAQMDKCEKYRFMQGVGWTNTSAPMWGYYIGNTLPVSRLGVPSLNMQDAADGFRTIWDELVGTVTGWPSLLSLAATWNRDAVHSFAVAMGREFVDKGANVILGPSINVHRVARGGRNFEYLSGDDPHLGSVLTAAYVEGVQSQGLMSVMKHYVLNNQETKRDSSSSNANAKTKWELYYPPFQAAVDAGATAAMCSYNKEDGSHSCSNSQSLHDLKDKMGFQGFVQSDWWATHETSVTKGLDQEMPGAPTAEFLGPKALEEVDESAVDEAAVRIVSGMYKVGLFNRSQCVPPSCTKKLLSTVTNENHKLLARKLAAESIVLLKNDKGVLPLTASKTKSVVVIGSPAVAKAYNPAKGSSWNQGDYYSGGGSGHVTAASVVTPFDGIHQRASKEMEVTLLASDNATEAAAAARKHDLAIVVAATTSGEAADRANLLLDYNANELISAVAATGKPVVVLVQAPGAVLMPWKDKVAAAAIMFLGGQETGNAWADVLFGDVAPAGRLPIMLPMSENDTIAPSQNDVIAYSEGMSTSYRNKGFKAAFPFGHGLTYATFAYSGAQAAPCFVAEQNALCVSVTVQNTGAASARAVPQLYLEFPAEARHPSPLLKGFANTELIASGGRVSATIVLTKRELSYFDDKQEAWVVASNWTAHIGESSADLRLSLPLVQPKRLGTGVMEERRDDGWREVKI